MAGVVTIGNAGAQVNGACVHQAGLLDDVGRVRLGVEKAAACDKVADGVQPGGSQRGSHLVGVANAHGGQNEDVIVGEVGDDLRLGEGVEVGAAFLRLLAPEIDAEELLKVPFLPGDDLVVLVARGGVKEGDLAGMEGEGAGHGEGAGCGHVGKIAAREIIEDGAGRIVAAVHGGGDGGPGQVGMVAVVEGAPQPLVGVAARDDAGLAYAQGGENLPGGKVVLGRGGAQGRGEDSQQQGDPSQSQNYDQKQAG